MILAFFASEIYLFVLKAEQESNQESRKKYTIPIYCVEKHIQKTYSMLKD